MKLKLIPVLLTIAVTACGSQDKTVAPTPKPAWENRVVFTDFNGMSATRSDLVIDVEGVATYSHTDAYPVFIGQIQLSQAELDELDSLLEGFEEHERITDPPGPDQGSRKIDLARVGVSRSEYSTNLFIDSPRLPSSIRSLFEAENSIINRIRESNRD